MQTGIKPSRHQAAAHILTISADCEKTMMLFQMTCSKLEPSPSGIYSMDTKQRWCPKTRKEIPRWGKYQQLTGDDFFV